MPICCPRILFFLLPLSLICCGCARPTDKVEVSGNVTWEGRPLPEGDVTFFFDGQKPAGAGRVEAGRFKFLSRTGKVRVEILATRDSGKIDKVEKAATREQYLPPRYNRDSELTVDVTAAGKNEFDFSLSP